MTHLAPAEPLVAAEERSEHRPTLFLVLSVVALLTIVAFLPVVDNGWVEWDDERNFLRNTSYRGLGLQQLEWAWSTILLGVYQPIAWHLLSLQYTIVGIAPAGYHAASLLMHTANAVVLCFVILAILDRHSPILRRAHPVAYYTSAGVMTTLFAVHPLRVEVVAWVSCQPYLPCIFFYLLSVLAYVHAFPAGSAPRTRRLVLSFVFFVTALLCKAVAVSLPFILLILDFSVLERLKAPSKGWLARPQRSVLLEKLPFFAVSAIGMMVAVVARRHSSVSDVIEQASLLNSAQLAQAAYGIWFYLLKTVWPSPLSAYYAVPSDLAWSEPRFFLAIVGVVVVTAAIIGSRHRWPSLLAAWCGYVVILAPNLGLVQISRYIAADRYGYAPMLVVTVFGAGLLLRGLAGLHRRPALAAAATAAIVLAIATSTYLSWQQTRAWQSTEALWRGAMESGDANEEVHNFLGLALAKAGKKGEAEVQFREAVRLNSSYAEVHNNLGAMYAEAGDYARAEAEFRRTLQIRPHSEARNNLGAIFFLRRDLPHAVGEFVESLRVDPDNDRAKANLDAALKALAASNIRLVVAAEDFVRDPADSQAYERVLELLRDHRR